MVAAAPNCFVKLRTLKVQDQTWSIVFFTMLSTCHCPPTSNFGELIYTQLWHFTNMASTNDAQKHIERLRNELDPARHPRFASLMTNALDLWVEPFCNFM